MTTWKHDWIDDAGVYSEALTNPYHHHRLNVIQSLIPESLWQPKAKVLDYGCGDGVLIESLAKSGANVRGFDISETLIEKTRSRLASVGLSHLEISCGGCELFSQITDSSLDGILCFNVLAYMTPQETKNFYSEARRTLRLGGYLVVTHSNELFDLFSCNGFTYDFFCKYLVAPLYHEPLKSKLPDMEKRRPGRNTDVFPQTDNFFNRENPLNYRFKLQEWGFKELRQEFINHHAAPPALLESDNYIDTLDWGDEDRWKLMFVCSTFGSCAMLEK